jgi:hypothetical protein
MNTEKENDLDKKAETESRKAKPRGSISAIEPSKVNALKLNEKCRIEISAIIKGIEIAEWGEVKGTARIEFEITDFKIKDKEKELIEKIKSSKTEEELEENAKEIADE